MTDDGRSVLPAPGWYIDPESGARRWWNGIAWANRADERHALSAATVGLIRQPALPTSTSVSPWPVWGIVILPLLAAAPIVLTDLKEYARAVLAATAAHAVAPLPPGFVAAQLLGLVTFVAAIVLASLDRRILIRRGVVRPFHWAWSVVPLVYLIGRAVVLRRRVGRGSAPVWVYLLLSVGVGVVEGVLVTASVASAIAERYAGG
jgi:uncharacterized protein DUF2510